MSAGFPAVSRATAGRLADRPAVERPEISHEVNQYTARTVPAAVDVLGVAASGSAVTVNGATAYRRGEYFWQELTVANASAPVATAVTVGAGGTPTTGKLVTPPANQSFVHDLDGNLTDDGVWTYTWDLAHEIKPRRPSSGRRGEEARQRSSSPRVVISRAGENRLVGMQHKTTLADTAARRKLAFEYDARGRRIRRQVFPWSGGGYSATATSDQRFVYDGWNLVAVFNASLTLQTAYIWGLDLSGTPQGAGGVGGLLASLTGTTAQFAAFDGNGNVRALADGGTGAWSAQYEYGPFGELIRATGPQAKANPFRFSTKWHDDESDLLYYGYRYYQPGTGRWLGRDPILDPEFPDHAAKARSSVKTEGGNLLAFSANDPQNGFDYLGLLVVTDWRSIYGSYKSCGKLARRAAFPGAATPYFGEAIGAVVDALSFVGLPHYFIDFGGDNVFDHPGPPDKEHWTAMRVTILIPKCLSCSKFQACINSFWSSRGSYCSFSNNCKDAAVGAIQECGGIIKWGVLSLIDHNLPANIRLSISQFAP